MFFTSPDGHGFIFQVRVASADVASATVTVLRALLNDLAHDGRGQDKAVVKEPEHTPRIVQELFAAGWVRKHSGWGTVWARDGA